jgi:RHS repeat-associated protein
MIREMNSNETNDYICGLDLSGTLQGAGTIGGVLACIHQSSLSIHHFLYDANGNVAALIDANGALVTGYSYDPFGNLLSTTNHQPLPIPSNPFRFSTKYVDSETGLYYYGYRHYSPSLGRWLNRDPIEEEGGKNLYGFVENSAASSADALGLYLVAFDGTGNYKGLTPATNVERLFKAYRKQGNYYPGVGSRWWSKISGGLHGLGGEVRAENAWRDLVEHYKNMTDDQMAKDPVDIIGFSRGAALARHFANIIYQRGDPRRYQREIMSYQPRSRRWTVVQGERMSGCPMPIRFLGIFDTVASFGVPGDRRNIGYDLSIPPNVQNVRHAISRDESRSLFPLTRIKSTATRIERMFPGVHSDVGGGYSDNKDIQYGPLLWMWQEGKDVRVPWDKPVELEGWVPPSGGLMGHQSDVPLGHDHTMFEWAPVGPGDKLKRPDSWEE